MLVVFHCLNPKVAARPLWDLNNISNQTTKKMEQNNDSMRQLLIQIAGNGVGFRELFFRTSLPTEALFDNEGEPNKEFFAEGNKPVEALEIRFSDGERLL